jgi:hypothetical protein
MPGFAPPLADEDRWAIVAFVKRLGHLSPDEYASLNASIDKGTEPVTWGIDDDRGFQQLSTGNAIKGQSYLFSMAVLHAT